MHGHCAALGNVSATSLTLLDPPPPPPLLPPRHSAVAHSAGLLASPQLSGLRRLDLLKALERLTGEAFAASLSSDPAAAGAVQALGGGATAEQRLLRAALHQQLSGTPEYSPAFYAVLEACAHRQQLQR